MRACMKCLKLPPQVKNRRRAFSKTTLLISLNREVFQLRNDPIQFIDHCGWGRCLAENRNKPSVIGQLIRFACLRVDSLPHLIADLAIVGQN
jgi:hypothetical protein